MQDKRITESERDQIQAGIDTEPIAEVIVESKSYQEKSQAPSSTRKDKKRVHAMRHAVLSRYPLQALARLDENLRQLRKIESKFRAETGRHGG